MVCIKEMCAMRVKFSRKHKSLEIRHFFFSYMRPVSKAFIGFSKGYVTPPPNSKNHYRDEGGVGEDSWESLGLQGDPTSPFWRRSTLGFLWRKWCWSWNSSTLATSCEELTHWKGLWCWEGLGAVGEGDNRGWDGWMASLTRWTWVWVNCESWWWTGRPGVLRFMGSQRVGHDWATEMNWTELNIYLDWH